MSGPLEGAARRPVAVLMVVAATVVFGVVSYFRLDLALLPDLSYPTLTVRTEFPGAGPRDVDKRVTEPLEKRLATTSGLVSMTSVSRSTFSDITLEFRWDTDMTEVRADVESKIDAATLPEEAQRPLVLPYDPNLDPVLRIAVSGRGAGEADLALARKLAEEEVEKELKKLKGVAAAKIRGGREREISVHLDDQALLRAGIALEEVATALLGANRNEAAGLINEGPIEYVVRSVNELRTVKEIEAVVVKSVSGVPVRVRDLGTVTESFKERELAAYLDGKEAVLVEVYKRADSNVVAVAKAVRERMSGGSGGAAPERRGRGGPRGGPAVVEEKGLEEALHAWVDLRVLTDQSRFIEGALDEVRDTAILGGLLAVFVLYLFLRDALSTLVAGAVIPICAIATFAPLFLADVSLNIMSLGGLALGVGMLVDNAIVVLESTTRLREKGLSPIDAAVQGVREVAGAITSSTLTTVCVFFPIVFVGEAGAAGQLFRDLSLAVVYSLMLSLFVALFVIPTCLATLPRLVPKGAPPAGPPRFGIPGRSLGPRHVLAWKRLARERGFRRVLRGLELLLALPFAFLATLVKALARIAAVAALAAMRLLSLVSGVVLRPLASGFLRGYGAMERAYVPFLHGCLARPGTVLLLAALAFGWAGYRATTLSPDLMPEAWTGEFDLEVSFAPGTALERTAERARAVEAEVRKLPEVEWVAATVGVEADADRAADEGEHTARLTIHLKRESRSPEAERRVREAAERLVAAIPDAQPPEVLPSTLFRFALPLKVIFFGGGERDLAVIGRAAEEAAAAIRTLDGVQTVQGGAGRGAREVRLEFDRLELFRRGLTAEEVATRLRGKLEGRIPTALVEGSERTDIRVRVEEADREHLRDLLHVDVAAAGKGPLPLSALLRGDPAVAEGPGEIRRVGGRHAAVVTAAYEGLQLGRVTDEARALCEPIARRHGVEVEVAGRSLEAKQSMNALLYALALAAFLVYAVMAIQFESLVQPLIIMVSLPLAGVGTVVALDLLDLPASVVVLLGAILLVGIAVNNAIVLVDCVNRRRALFPTLTEAIAEASRERLRPILMTTGTTILGLIPLTGVLALIPGADRFPLGLGGGDAAELRSPMAITVIGGLFSSTVLTLVVVPVLYQMSAKRGRA
jgi:HAE1 family hydrophobic/amphiphilic exporter-1